MALIQDVVSPTHQLNISNAYLKIDNINIRNKEASFDLLVYSSKEARLQGASPITSFRFNTDIRALPEGKNIYEQLYKFIKLAHPQFNLAEDDF